ncbi:MAG: DUF2244 domain-containing protein [Pseudomonadota bacterium]
MPFRIITETAEAPVPSGASLLEVELWPHQSLTGTGFVVVIAGTFLMFCIPLFGLIGSVVLWGILPFAMGALGLLWLAINRNWKDREILETFSLWPDRAVLIRRDPDGSKRDWEANPYWVRVERHAKVGQIEDYLTLEGGPRPVEIGAFLTPEERRDLEIRLRDALRGLR